MPICNNCKENKEGSEFHKNASRKNGLSSTCKKCARARVKNWYIENKERSSQYQKQYRKSESVAQRKREYGRKYRAEHKDSISVRKRAWKKKFPARVKELNKKSFQKRRNEIPDIFLARKRFYERIRRSRKRNLPVDFSKNDEEFCFFYWNYSCAVCGREDIGMDLDHWVPISFSGEHNPGTVVSNIVPLCSGINGCNNSKRNKMPEVWMTQKFGVDFSRIKTEEIDAFFKDAKVRKELVSHAQVYNDSP
jgi:hypothetical protein